VPSNITVAPPSGTAGPLPEAKPVLIAPWLAVKFPPLNAVYKMLAAAKLPLPFGFRTVAALAQLPLVLVRLKLMVVDECVKPSKLLIVWLKLPNPSSFPAPPLLQGPGVNPMPLFVPIFTRLPSDHEAALTLTATAPFFPSRKIFPLFVREVNVMVAVVLLVLLTSTLTNGPEFPGKTFTALSENENVSALAC